jgi:hypothetical protein
MAPLICWSFSSSTFRYLLADQAVPAMCRSLAAARLSADPPRAYAAFQAACASPQWNVHVVVWSSCADTERLLLSAIQIVQQCGRFATYRGVSCPFASTICIRITACSIGGRGQDLTRATLRGESRGLLRAFYGFGGTYHDHRQLENRVKRNAKGRSPCRQRCSHSHCPPARRRRQKSHDEAHFTDDLGADWLDRLELMLVRDR